MALFAPPPLLGMVLKCRGPLPAPSDRFAPSQLCHRHLLLSAHCMVLQYEICSDVQDCQFCQGQFRWPVYHRQGANMCTCLDQRMEKACPLKTMHMLSNVDVNLTGLPVHIQPLMLQAAQTTALSQHPHFPPPRNLFFKIQGSIISWSLPGPFQINLVNTSIWFQLTGCHY